MPRKDDQPPRLGFDAPKASDLALKLLQMQQRLDAFDHLYNEEMGGFKSDLRQLKQEFIQQHAATQAERAKPTRRQVVARQRPRSGSAPAGQEKEGE